MNRHYSDILSRIPTPPIWWDEHAVPRFCEFSPSAIANIYAIECCLLLIECQSCGREFRAAMSWHPMTSTKFGTPRRSLSACIEAGSISYLDPPNVECCPAGPTMTSDTRRVLEFWKRDHGAWERARGMEREIEP